MGDQKRKLLLTLLLVGVVGTLTAYGTYSAFTATTVNAGNQFTSGTVKIDDDSGATTALFPASIGAQGPGVALQRCLRVKYNGSLTAASVKLFISTGAVTNGDKYTLRVERGVGGTGLTTLDGTRACTGFGAGGTVTDAFATGDLGTFPTVYGSGVDGKASAGTWAQNDWVDYRFSLTVKDDATENAHTTANPTGTFSFTWKASS
jgi:hypothetical protein